MSAQSGELSVAARPGEPLAAWFSAPRADGALSLRRFECTSHGDLVAGRCWWPAGVPRGVALAVHPLGGNANAPEVAAAARAWGTAGLVSAVIDLPLHGERHNAKLSRRALAGRAPAHADHALWQGLLAQAVRDLARALDALATQGARGPVACVAFGDAAPVAAAFAALDARVARAVVLAPASAGGAAAAGLPQIVRPEDLSL